MVPRLESRTWAIPNTGDAGLKNNIQDWSMMAHFFLHIMQTKTRFYTTHSEYTVYCKGYCKYIIVCIKNRLTDNPAIMCSLEFRGSIKNAMSLLENHIHIWQSPLFLLYFLVGSFSFQLLSFALSTDWFLVHSLIASYTV